MASARGCAGGCREKGQQIGVMVQRPGSTTTATESTGLLVELPKLRQAATLDAVIDSLDGPWPTGSKEAHWPAGGSADGLFIVRAQLVGESEDARTSLSVVTVES